MITLNSDSSNSIPFSKPLSNRQALLVSLAFNGYWLLCVLLQSQVFILLAMILVFAFVYERSAVFAAIPIAFIGTLVDFSLTTLGLFSFEQAVQSGELVLFSTLPVWLVFLWLGFSVFAWLMRAMVIKHNFFLLTLVTGFAGASSYYAGVKLGAAEFPLALLSSLFILFTVWCVLGAAFVLWIRFLSQNIFKENFGENL